MTALCHVIEDNKRKQLTAVIDGYLIICIFYCFSLRNLSKKIIKDLNLFAFLSAHLKDEVLV